MRVVHFFVPVLALTWGASLQAQQAPTVTARAMTSAPTIDGRLDEGAWTDAELVTGFVQREPIEGQPVSERTEVRIAYDEDALYVGAWLYDRDPSGLVFGQTLRDASLEDTDAFMLVLDTYLDHQNGFVFATTPAGIEYDGQVTNEGEGGGGGGGGRGRQQRGSGGGFNKNWDGSWEVATSADGEGWYAEMRIPFTTLRYGAGGPQTWGLNFERRIRRNSEQSVWSPIPRQFNLNRVSLAGTMDLQAPVRRTVTVSPFALGNAFKDYTVSLAERDYEGKVGGDAKVGLNQSLTLDLTVNTDFAQAEVDDQQVNLTRFSLFFPEKRAFFLENAGTFAVGASQPAELFFSRRIGLADRQEVPIKAGARLTGKIGDVQIGILNIQTDDLTAIDPLTGLPVIDPLTGLPEVVAPDNNFGVVRALREFDNRTRLGGIFVSRLNTGSTDDYNLTYGLDGRLGIGQRLTFDGWASLTTTPVAVGQVDMRTGFNNGEYGFAGSGEYLTRDWEVSTGYRQVGAGFNPEVGFVNRWAYRHINARTLYHLRTESVSWFREFRPHVSWTQFWTLGGFSESYQVHIDNHFQFESGAFVSFPGFNLTGEGLEQPFEIRPGIVIPPGSYDHYEMVVRVNTNRAAPFSVEAGFTGGGFYTGTHFTPNATVSYRFRDRFTTSLRVNHFDVQLDEGDFSTAVVALNGSYSFTPRIYLQANIQYNDETETLGTNLRLGLLDTAGTGLFIVYNDTEYVDIDLGALGSRWSRPRQQQRQLVIKYMRLFDLTR